MRIIKEDKRYNPNSIKLVLSLLCSLIFTLAAVSVCSKIMAALINDSRKQFDSYWAAAAESYKKALSLKFETYFFALDSFKKIEYSSRLTDRELQAYVSNLIELNHPDFMNVSFVNLEGTGYAQNKIIYDASERDYFKAITRDRKDTFISSPIHSKLNSEGIIIIASSLKDDDGNLRGLLTASVRLSTFNKIVSGMNEDTSSWIFILEKDGNFICHPDSSMLFKKFVPQQQEFEQLTSERIAKSSPRKLRSSSTDGKKIMIFTTRISETDWTLGVSVLDNLFEAFNQKESRYRILIVVFGLVTMLLLTALEYYFIHILQRHQHIETFHDPLTTLWTRKHFELEASRFLKRNPFTKFMFIECDIRGFRFTYQNYGEDASDNMIFFFSKILNKAALKFNGIIGRGFADHFYILVKIPSVRRGMTAFKKELEKINEQTKDYAIPFMGKFGISFLMPENKDRNATIQELIGQASFAKTMLSENLLTQYAIYNSKLLNKIREERYIESHMEEALKNHEFFVMYQPKISLENDRIVGAEALVRWKNPEKGLMMPDSFIPLFERNGFITKLDFFVYEEVFKFLEAQILNKQPIVPISVNMSRNHSKPDKFMHDFLEVFKRYSIPSNLIQVEIIERSVMDDNTLREITDKLHKEGFSVAMDDFGSGESSLNMLTKIPIDVLKFDRTFLTSSTKDNGEMDKNSADFIEILIEMSKVLNKSTVFEGVETAAQRDFLRSINCDEAQGYFYSKPLTPQDFIEFIKAHK